MKRKKISKINKYRGIWFFGYSGTGKTYVSKFIKSIENFRKRWVKVMDDMHEKHGSHDSRKNFTGVRFERL